MLGHDRGSKPISATRSRPETNRTNRPGCVWFVLGNRDSWAWLAIALTAGVTVTTSLK
jgi:hypothetical protein